MYRQSIIAIAASSCALGAQASAPPCRDYSSPIPGQVASLFIDLIQSALARPSVNAVDAIATTMHWEKAGQGWVASYANCGPKFTPGIEMIGGDPGNGFMFVKLTLDFDPLPIVAELKKTFTLQENAVETKTGNAKYTLSYQGRMIGQVWLEQSNEDNGKAGAAVFYSARRVHEMAARPAANSTDAVEP